MHLQFSNVMIPVFKKRLNKFVPCSVTKNRDLFSRLGERLPHTQSSDNVANFGASKLDAYAEADKVCKKMQQEEYEEYSKQEAELARLREIEASQGNKED